MAAVRVYLHGGIDSRLPQAPVVCDSRIHVAEIVDRLREKRRGSFGVNRVFGADLHSAAALPRSRRILSRAKIPRIYRHLEIRTAREIIGIIDTRIEALAPVRRGAHREVRSSGKADDADAAGVDRVLRGVTAQKPYRALHVAKRGIALVGSTVEKYRGGEAERIEPFRNL